MFRMVVKSIFAQVMRRGELYSFVFFMFFIMSVVPLAVLFFTSVGSYNPAGIALVFVLGGILYHDFHNRRLFSLCRDMVLLNVTLWFLLGFFSFIQQFSRGGGFLTYVFLIPYAVVSGFAVFYLFKGAERKKEVVLKGAVAVSSMIAVVSAINGALLDATRFLFDHLQALEQKGVVQLLLRLNEHTHNPHIAFAVVFVLFNIPFVRFYLKGHRRGDLCLYFFPVGVYVVLAGLWWFVRDLLLQSLVAVV